MITIIKRIIKHLRSIIYYLLLLIGLITASWIIWSRFIRERTIRNIPDMLLTEYRVWILLYICYIYFSIAKSLISRDKNPTVIQEFLGVISDYFFKPLTLLDRAIKYNHFTKVWYLKFSSYIAFNHPNSFTMQRIVFLFRVLPRIILVSFLFVDTFWFHKLELFYKLILIGILPFLFRYFKYSLKDILNYWIEALEQDYDVVEIFEKGYKLDLRRVGKTEAIYHCEKATIREYVEIKWDNYLEYLCDIVEYEYIAIPYAHEHKYHEYFYKKYGHANPKLMTSEDLKELDKKFNELMPQIIALKGFIENTSAIENSREFIRYTKGVIFSIYFICWGFILLISYMHKPIDLPMFKYLISNIMMYLMIMEDTFSGVDSYSINENLITVENVKDLLLKVIKVIKYIISKIINKFL